MPAARRWAAWQLLLGAAPVVIALYYWLVSVGPQWAGVQVALYCSANGALGVAAIVAAKYHPSVRAGFVLIGASALVSLVADVIFYCLALIEGEVAYPSVADVGYLAAYPLLAGGFLIVIRRRTPGWDVAGLVDAAIVAIGAGFLVYALVIAPTLDIGAADVVTLVSVAYPVGDLMLITVGAGLLLGAGSRTVSLAMIGFYLLAVLYADTAYSVQSLAGTYHAANYLDAIWITASFTLAAGLLHPSIGRLIAPATVGAPTASAARLVILALSALIAPTTLLVQHLRGTEAPVVAATTVCNVLFLLVLARMAGLVRAQRQAAITDSLTGLRTRGHFTQVLRTEIARASRSHQPVGMLLLDIDHFKTVNDTYGHHGGDLVLVEVAARLRSLIRPGDLVARYGGEEFAVVTPGADRAEAAAVAERIRRGIAAAPMAVGDGRAHRVTVSVGVAVLPDPWPTMEELVLAADRALYVAKNKGRDQICESPKAPGAATAKMTANVSA